MNEECIFCLIAEGKAPGSTVYQDEQLIAFQDIAPKTPVHLLIVPRQHYESLNRVTEENSPLLGHMIVVAAKLALAAGIANRGYRLVINTGPDAGQSVSHLHLHLIGGTHLPVFFPTDSEIKHS